MVEVSRIQKALERWGDRFLKRVFTQAEIEYCRDKVHAASRFALRFAAKEAFSKALGTGFRSGLSFRQIPKRPFTKCKTIIQTHYHTPLCVLADPGCATISGILASLFNALSPDQQRKPSLGSANPLQVFKRNEHLAHRVQLYLRSQCPDTRLDEIRVRGKGGNPSQGILVRRPQNAYSRSYLQRYTILDRLRLLLGR